MTRPLTQHRACPASSEFAQFAHEVATYLEAAEHGWLYSSKTPTALQSQREDQQFIHLDLTPFEGLIQPANAAHWFSHIDNIEQLIVAYQQAKATCTSEPAAQVHRYAQNYLDSRFEAARTTYDDADARLIADWVSQLDTYAAVKSVECLLDSQNNLVLFRVAAKRGWQVLFDHLAIRCGSAKHQHAEQIVTQLLQQGYVQPQLQHERFYQFDDGWNAYPLYKMLANGQVIRLFIDQSDADQPQQIIQHWNHCYGFTAHHLALRVVRHTGNHCEAVSLKEVINALAENGIPALTPTGFYTHGLLEQVFLKPYINTAIPSDIQQTLSTIDPHLTTHIKNGKLIELVSRRELPADMVPRFTALYDLKEQPSPLSAPIYPYFLPAQAAHVIRTSLESIHRE